MNIVYFGIAGYPEIKRVKLSPDYNHERVMTAFVSMPYQGDTFKGMYNFPRGHKDAQNHRAVIELAKQGVDWHRRNA